MAVTVGWAGAPLQHCVAASGQPSLRGRSQTQTARPLLPSHPTRNPPQVKDVPRLAERIKCFIFSRTYKATHAKVRQGGAVDRAGAAGVK